MWGHKGHKGYHKVTRPQGCRGEWSHVSPRLAVSTGAWPSHDLHRGASPMDVPHAQLLPSGLRHTSGSHLPIVCRARREAAEAVSSCTREGCILHTRNLHRTSNKATSHWDVCTSKACFRRYAMGKYATRVHTCLCKTLRGPVGSGLHSVLVWIRGIRRMRVSLYVGAG